jgi:hypothetical protein
MNSTSAVSLVEMGRKALYVIQFGLLEIILIFTGPFVLVYDPLVRQGSTWKMIFAFDGKNHVLLAQPVRMTAVIVCTLIFWQLARYAWQHRDSLLAS